jgi:DNA invertase Pin-like site-specific DNA recombinase
MTRQTRHLRPTDLAGLRWRGFARESTEEQTARGTPVERQRHDIERAAEELGLIAVPPLWYQSTGSGEREGIPELQQALADAGQYDILVVFATSRFARRRAEAVRMKAAFAKAGIIIYFVAERMISGVYASSLQEGVGEVLDEHANEEKRLFVSGGLRERQLSGKWVGSIPYALRRHLADNADGTRSWDGTLEPEPAEAAVLRRIFGECLAGHSMPEIALRLNAESLTNRGGPWRKSTIRKMIANPIYAGRLVRYRSPTQNHYFNESDAHDGRQTLDVPWAIISPVDWQAAQSVFPGRRSPMKPGRQYPLSAVLHCGKCGGRMQGAYNGKGDRYYRCGTRAETGQCAGPSVKADGVEDAFADWLENFQLPADWRQAIARLREAPKPSSAKEAKLRQHLERIKTLFAAGDMEWPEYAAERDKTRELLAEQVPPDPDSLERIAAVLAELGPLWRNDPVPALPALMLDRAIVNDRREVEFQPKASLRSLFSIASVGRSPRPRSRRCATPSPPSSTTVTSSPSKVSRT